MLLSFTSTTLLCKVYTVSTAADTNSQPRISYYVVEVGEKRKALQPSRVCFKTQMAARWIRRRLSGEPDSERENNKMCRHGRIHNRSETSLRRRVMERRSSENVKVPDSHTADIKTIEVTVSSNAHRPESTVISKARSTVIGIKIS